MANDHPLTARISDQLREYIQRVSRLPAPELEEELAAQIARLQARDTSITATVTNHKYPTAKVA